MMTTASDLVDQYLRRLDAAARSLPRADRDELVAEIRQHLSAALTPDATEVDARNVLDSLGDPEDIVAAARPDGAAPPVRRGMREILALLFLVTGFPPFVGWIIGLALLLWSPLWTARQKLLGALVWPGGWVAVSALVLAGGQTACSTATTATPTPGSGVVLTTATTVAAIAGDCTGGLGILGKLGVTVVLLAPIVVAAYLYRAAGD